MRYWLGRLSLSLLILTGCSSSPVRNTFADLVDGLDNEYPSTQTTGTVGQLLATRSAVAGFAGATQTGSGDFVGQGGPAVVTAVPTPDGQGYELNLVNAPIAQAAKAVLGDALGVNYVVDPRATGTITLQTSSPVSQSVLAEILESALAVNGLALTVRSNVYQIVPIGEAMSSTPPVNVPGQRSAGPGMQVQVIELRHANAEEIKTILEPISRQGSILRADSGRNYIMIAGNPTDLQSMREAISLFDVDWMRGMSVAIHPLKTSDPVAVAEELATVFGISGQSTNNSIKFIPNRRLNAVLVITSRPTYLTRAAAWIDKLDAIAHTNDDQLFVYQIQNRPAAELAAVLTAVLSGASKIIGDGQSSGVAPDLSPELMAMSGEGADGGFANGESDDMSVGGSPNAARPAVTADVENNALLIQTTAREYDRVARILRQLDVMPIQVMIEAVIAEVTLNDELEFGLRWFFESGAFSLRLTDVASGFVGPSFPGFSWSYLTDDIKVTLNALASITDVNVVSAPTLMALNNQQAVLQVGDQVPIVTQQAVGTGAAGAPVVNSVEMKDTGIILRVVPRVNNAGRVMLDIEQEASSVVKTTSSGIDSPTIQQRRISTRVLVHDGESIALGGLIQERNSLTRSQIPLLGDIPLVGNAFKNKTDTINRTELIIFIRPRVVRNQIEARGVTDEYRQQLRLDSPFAKTRGGDNRFEQDIKRLIH